MAKIKITTVLAAFGLAMSAASAALAEDDTAAARNLAPRQFREHQRLAGRDARIDQRPITALTNACSTASTAAIWGGRSVTAIRAS